MLYYLQNHMIALEYILIGANIDRIICSTNEIFKDISRVIEQSCKPRSMTFGDYFWGLFFEDYFLETFLALT